MPTKRLTLEQIYTLPEFTVHTYLNRKGFTPEFSQSQYLENIDGTEEEGEEERGIPLTYKRERLAATVYLYNDDMIVGEDEPFVKNENFNDLYVEDDSVLNFLYTKEDRPVTPFITRFDLIRGILGI